MCKAVSGAVVVIVNLLFIPVGLALIVFGALIKWNPNLLVDRIVPALTVGVDDEEMSARHMVNDIIGALGDYGLVIFIFGIFLFLLSFCAVFGVCCKSKLLLGTYAGCLLLSFATLLIFTIVFGVHTTYFKQESENRLQQLILTRYVMDNQQQRASGMTKWLNTFQIRNYCCGSKDYTDFQENESFKRQQYKIPYSCCRNPQDKTCWEAPDGRNSYMSRGCNTYIWEELGRHINYVLYALIGMLVIIFLFATLSIYLLSVYSRNELQSV